MRTEARLRERGRAISAKSLERSTKSASFPEQSRPPPLSVRSPAMGVRLALETTAARGARRALARRRPRRRDDAPRQGPLEGRSRGGRRARGAAFPTASRSSRRRTARRRRRRWPPRSSAPSTRLAWNRAGANLLSGIASALVAGHGAELGLFEVDEGALPEALARTRPRVVTLGNLFRDQLDRYGELEIVAERWRPPSASSPRRRRSSSTRDDPIVADLADGRDGASAVRARRPAAVAAGLQHAADSKYCVRCGAPYDYDGGVRRATSATTAVRGATIARPALDVVARDIELRGLQASRFRLVAPPGDGRDRARAARPLQRLQRDGRGVALAGRRRRRSRTSARASRASVRRSVASSASRRREVRRAPARSRTRRERTRPCERSRSASPPCSSSR